MKNELHHLIRKKYQHYVLGKRFATVNPCNEQVIAEISEGDR